MRLLISLSILDILCSRCFAEEKWENWKPTHDFQELALMLRDYENRCTNDYSYDRQEKVIGFQYMKSPECVEKHNVIWEYIYSKFPMIRSGEI